MTFHRVTSLMSSSDGPPGVSTGSTHLRDCYVTNRGLQRDLHIAYVDQRRKSKGSYPFPTSWLNAWHSEANNLKNLLRDEGVRERPRSLDLRAQYNCANSTDIRRLRLYIS